MAIQQVNFEGHSARRVTADFGAEMAVGMSPGREHFSLPYVQQAKLLQASVPQVYMVQDSYFNGFSFTRLLSSF